MIGKRQRMRGDVPVWSIAFRAPDETRAFQARLPSRSGGMWFEAAFEATVSWNGAGAPARTRALARIQREVVRLSSERSARFHLGDRGTAEADIACALVEEWSLEQEEVRELAVTVVLTVDPDDLALERERERVGPQEEIHAALHQARMRRVRELRRDVLSDPLVARVWWFEQHPDRLNEVDRAGAALDLMATPEESADDLGPRQEGEEESVLDVFLSGLEEWELPAVLERLTTMLEGFERRDLADRLQRRWKGEGHQDLSSGHLGHRREAGREQTTSPGHV
ncbi:hypothetical protein [Nocardiopsis halotolerans]|uniref:hypothetical protein n=1 Tax=Nocardiopsis halotolerans TaxID=124252 RepID=UPI00036FB9D5|nr:hypothetical protein [Nocardiopsis halotolerans]